MRIDVLTLFPEACEPFFASSIIGRARASGIVELCCHQLRDYSQDPHRKVDDRPFGGGAGMVLACQPVFDAVAALESAAGGPVKRVLLCPQGRRLTQPVAEALAREPRLILIAGHYEGFDERIRVGLAPLELSIGDYVLSGGESAAMVAVDAIVRLLPGALGAEDALAEESFSAGLLEYPQYTRPRDYRGLTVPDVLLSGDHAAIARWRRDQAERRTRERRPDLLRDAAADTDERRSSDAQETD